MGPLKLEEFWNIKKTINNRIDVIRKAWRLAEIRGDEYVLQLLKKGLKEKEELAED